MVMNHSKLSVGIQTWIWLLKIRLPARIFVLMREKVKELTEKKMCIIFTLKQIFLECLNRECLTCSAKGSERLLWAGSRVACLNSTVDVARKLLSYIYTFREGMLFKNAPAALIMQRYGPQVGHPSFKWPKRQRRGIEYA